MNLKQLKQIKDAKFRRNEEVRVTLPTGRTLEGATYIEPYGTNKHTVKYDNQLYGVDEASIEKIKGQYAGRKRYYSQKEKDKIYYKLEELKDLYNDLKEQRRQLSIDMEQEYGNELNGNNDEIVLDEISQRYGEELDVLDDEIVKTRQKYMELEDKYDNMFKKNSLYICK